jgi:hypothetical protein
MSLQKYCFGTLGENVTLKIRKIFMAASALHSETLFTPLSFGYIPVIVAFLCEAAKKFA